MLLLEFLDRHAGHNGLGVCPGSQRPRVANAVQIFTAVGTDVVFSVPGFSALLIVVAVAFFVGSIPCIIIVLLVVCEVIDHHTTIDFLHECGLDYLPALLLARTRHVWGSFCKSEICFFFDLRSGIDMICCS